MKKYYDEKNIFNYYFNFATFELLGKPSTCRIEND